MDISTGGGAVMVMLEIKEGMALNVHSEEVHGIVNGVRLFLATGEGDDALWSIGVWRFTQISIKRNSKHRT